MRSIAMCAVTTLAARMPAAMLFAIVPWLAPALADDAYVCDGGRLVYARPETLEKLKNTDPCVAGYYGIDLTRKAAAKPANTAAPPHAVALPPSGATAAANQSAPARRAPQAAIRPETPPAAPSARTGTARLEGAVPSDGHLRRAIGASTPPQPGPGTDFRAVRLLNAAPGADAVYQHTR